MARRCLQVLRQRHHEAVPVVAELERREVGALDIGHAFGDDLAVDDDDDVDPGLQVGAVGDPAEGHAVADALQHALEARGAVGASDFTRCGRSYWHRASPLVS